MYVESLPLYLGAFENHTNLREITLVESRVSRSSAIGLLISRLDGILSSPWKLTIRGSFDAWKALPWDSHAYPKCHYR